MVEISTFEDIKRHRDTMNREPEDRRQHWPLLVFLSFIWLVIRAIHQTPSVQSGSAKPIKGAGPAAEWGKRTESDSSGSVTGRNLAVRTLCLCYISLAFLGILSFSSQEVGHRLCALSLTCSAVFTCVKWAAGVCVLSSHRALRQESACAS